MQRRITISRFWTEFQRNHLNRRRMPKDEAEIAGTILPIAKEHVGKAKDMQVSGRVASRGHDD